MNARERLELVKSAKMMKEIAEWANVKVDIQPLEDMEGCYFSDDRLIIINSPIIESDLMEFWSIFLHELCHAILIDSKLAEPYPAEDDEDQYLDELITDNEAEILFHTLFPDEEYYRSYV